MALIVPVAAFVVDFEYKMGGMVKIERTPFRPVGRWKELSPKPLSIEKSCTGFQSCETMLLNQSVYTCLYADM
jgi:hypothetical protein